MYAAGTFSIPARTEAIPADVMYDQMNVAAAIRTTSLNSDGLAEGIYVSRLKRPDDSKTTATVAAAAKPKRTPNLTDGFIGAT
jgi:hypothetical protein